jgi:hypothetical protein
MTPTIMGRFNPVAFDTIALDSVLFDAATVELYLNTPPDTTPPLTWEVTYGGGGNDMAHDACRAFDGGYIVVGMTESFGNGGSDILLVHIDSLGAPIWQKTIGGALADAGYAILPTSDGGYVIAGESESFSPGGSMDALLVKIDIGGNVLWQKTYNHGLHERAFSVTQLSSNEFILAGTTGDMTFSETYVVKTSLSGDSVWANNYGGLITEALPSVAIAADGGIVIATGIVNDVNGEDIYLIKLDTLGQVIWTNTFGALGHDLAYGILSTTDQGFMIVGSSTSYGAGEADIFLQKANSLGDEVWAKTFGFLYPDYGYDLKPTPGGGFILGGSAYTGGAQNFYISRISDNGAFIWDNSYGGAATDICRAVFATRDGGYFAVGYTNSFGAGLNDMYLVKTDARGEVASPRFTRQNFVAAPERNSRFIF